MIKVISVRFRTAGKIYFFDPGEFEIEKGQSVIVETARGVEYGYVVGGIREVVDDKVIQPLKPVIRIATPEDDAKEQENLQKKEEAFKICQEKIEKHELEMKLVDAEYTFDNNKVLFYFTADGRIDFRELVKDLASVFKTRIELRQIGVRDEIKIMGGIGICGRVLCCHSYLSEFVPVSIKMAKEQNLSLNPTKISGVCGRLMCCLKNEEEIYGELNRILPNVGDFVTTDDGLRGEVHSVNVLRQLVKVIVDVGDEKEIKEYHGDQLQFRRKSRKDRAELSPEELAELERLEKQEELEMQEKQNARREAERASKQEREERKERRDRGGFRDRGNRTEQDARHNTNPHRDRRDRNAEAAGKDNADVSPESDNSNGGKDNRDNREKRDRNYNRGNRDNRDGRENKDNRVSKDNRENKDNRERRDNREGKENREHRDNRDGRENKDTHEARNRNSHRNRRNRPDKKES